MCVYVSVLISAQNNKKFYHRPWKLGIIQPSGTCLEYIIPCWIDISGWWRAWDEVSVKPKQSQLIGTARSIYQLCIHQYAASTDDLWFYQTILMPKPDIFWRPVRRWNEVSENIFEQNVRSKLSKLMSKKEEWNIAHQFCPCKLPSLGDIPRQ